MDCDGVAFIKQSDNVAVGFLLMDYVAWTARFSNRERVVSEVLKNTGSIKGKELLVDGWVAPVARKALEGRGWKVVEQAAKE